MKFIQRPSHIPIVSRCAIGVILAVTSMIHAATDVFGMQAIAAPTSQTSAVAAPTRDAYREAVAMRLIKEWPNDRWVRMTSRVLDSANPSPDGKYYGAGRGEVELALPLALAGAYFAEKGDAENGTRFTGDALKTVRACCRVAVDHYYADNEEPEGGNRGQISFVLPEVVQACVILKNQGALAGEERVRARTMLEIIADHRMKIMPEIGLGGMSNWINRAGLGVLRAANYLDQEWRADAAFAKARPDLPAKIEAMRRYALLPLKCGLDYPYFFKNLPGGKCSPGISFDKRDAERTEHPAPADRHPQFGITEDSSGYASDSVSNLLCMIAETPPARVPELTDARKKELCAWMQGWQATVMPVGTVPSYGDGTWDASSGWVAAFEAAATLFKNTGAYGNAAAGFRATAGKMFRYGQTTCAGFFNATLCRAALVTDDSIKAVEAPQKSGIFMQQNPKGTLQPGKIVLRGEAEQPENQPFAIFNTFFNSSHSHADIGCLIAYGSGGSVFQHEAGYDAGEMDFHQLFLVRPASEPFLPFAKVFQDPRETLLKKGDKGLFSSRRIFVSAEVNDSPQFSHARIVTVNRDESPNTRRVDYLLTRDAVLEKTSGALIVCDSIKSDVGTEQPLACSPVWHVQNILAKTKDGFLCEDDCQAIMGPKSKVPVKITSPVRPVWIGLAGPAGFAPDSLEWHFICRNGYHDIPQRQHLFLSGNISLKKGETVSMVTVFVPMPAGTKEMSKSPANIALDGGNATVTIGNLTCQFGKISGAPNATLKVAGKDDKGKPFEAIVPAPNSKNHPIGY